ncbi:coiled-coil domain-containing protein 15 [Clinocottus analis]|uniref:coiled-coil domain-containing protein 15 n=1 Tax=Clinocottus analis TaxID=304258 RepID=UPI0035C161C6
MSASRLVTSARCRCKASVSRSKKHPAPKGASKVLAERNPAVVAVGAWVECGQDLEHPWALALLTEEIQSEKRRVTEEGLQRFQDEVRHRVAQQAQVGKKRQQHQPDSMIKPDTWRTPQHQDQVWSQHVSAGERPMSAGGATQQRMTERNSHQSRGDMRQVRLRLAACRMVPHEEMMSDLPGGEWNIPPTRHQAGICGLKPEQEVEEQEEDVQDEEKNEDHLFTSQHECPLVQQKVNGPVQWDSEKSEPPAFKSIVRVPQALWPLPDQEELKRQRQSQFLMHRRLFMNIEREQVKENKLNRKHLKKNARIKVGKEQIRLEEERKLETVRRLGEARQKLEERELLILERLKLEEEERDLLLQKRNREEKGKVASRFIEALRAQMKQRLSQGKPEPPPLCCCASSFWESHPDTCANNCVFYNNPKAYAKALHSTMLSLELQ